MDMFEQALRGKLRYNFNGLCSTEDLFDLRVESLDQIYKDLNSKLKDQQDGSLLDKRTQEEEILTLKMDIVRYIVEAKLKDMEAREQEMENKARKHRIMNIIAEKQDKELYDKPLEELQKLVSEM